MADVSESRQSGGTEAGQGGECANNQSPFWGRALSILVFVVGLFAFLGVDSFSDFFLEIKTRIAGERIDYAKIGDFCGWTQGKYPGESDLDYGLRASWNMASAMLAMTAASLVMFTSMIGGIVWLFHRFGGFG